MFWLLTNPSSFGLLHYEHHPCMRDTPQQTPSLLAGCSIMNTILDFGMLTVLVYEVSPFTCKISNTLLHYGQIHQANVTSDEHSSR
jgi:hypothetical protein